MHTKLSDRRALAELPYFELNGDQLVLADDTVGPTFDMHTHLAMTFGRKRSVDLRRSWSFTEHYLPLEREIDLDVYMNRNFSEEDLTEMRRDLVLKGITSGGMRRTHTVPNLAREMKELGIAVSALLPIEYPLLSDNTNAFLQAAQHDPRFVCFGSVHPFASRACERLAGQKALGVRGIKLHPAMQLLPADHRRAMAVYRTCADLQLPVIWHCGPVDIEPWLSRWCSQVKHYWRAVHENPDTTFILGHSGALQMEMGLQLAQRYDNVYLELASQSLGNVRQILDEAPPERIMFGTDWPFYHQAIGLAKVLIVTEGDPGARRRVLWDNAAALLGLTEPAPPPAG